MASKTVKINDEISLVIYEGTSEIRIIDNATGKAYVLKANAIVNNPQPISSFTPPAIPGIGTRTVTEKKPASIFTISQESISLPAGAVIVDQATARWAEAAENGFRDNTFIPSVYGWNGSSPTLITANSYGTDSINWEIVNTDNILVFPAGTDINDTSVVGDPNNIIEVLPFSVVSTDVTVTKPTVISIAEIQAIAASSVDFIDFQARIAAL